MTEDIIGDALSKLRGAVTIVYPMGLPPYDPIRLEFEGNEDLSGTQVCCVCVCVCVCLEGCVSQLHSTFQRGVICDDVKAK